MKTKMQYLAMECNCVCIVDYAVRGTSMLEHIYNRDDFVLVKEMGATLSEQNGEQFFALSCPKFEGKCSVYPNRPSVCEAHQCDLLKSVNKEEIDLGKAKKISDEMKTLCTELDHARHLLTPNDKTQEISSRFGRLFASKESFELQKKHPEVFVKYAAYRVLKHRYFYHEDNSSMFAETL